MSEHDEEEGYESYTELMHQCSDQDWAKIRKRAIRLKHSGDDMVRGRNERAWVKAFLEYMDEKHEAEYHSLH